MRAVLDPNVLVSALLSPTGKPAALIRSWLGGEFELVVSPSLLEELTRVLTYPKIAKRITESDARAFVELLANHATLVDDPPGPPAVRSGDKDDDYLIALAHASSAMLVSGDSDLLSLSRRIPVRTAAEFHDLLVLPAPLINQLQSLVLRAPLINQLQSVRKSSKT